jgi:Outer membrane protein beta-barrel domain
MLHAQADHTATRAGDLQIGFGYAFAEPDYGINNFKGIAPYATFDFTNHLGVEADFRYLKDPSSLGMYEKTYEVGGRYHLNYRRFSPYGKFMYGRGVYNFQHDVANLAYNMFGGGGGADVKVSRSINVRVDFEYQSWLGFPPHGLNPVVGTMGVAYHFR